MSDDALDPIPLETIKFDVDDDPPATISEQKSSQPKIEQPQASSSPRQWSRPLRCFLSKLNEVVISKIWMHEYEYSMYEKKDSWMKFVSGICLTLVEVLAGGTMISILTDINMNDNKALFISLNVIVLLLTAISGIFSYIRESEEYNHKMDIHKYTYDSFYDLTLDIQSQITFEAERREDDRTFTSRVIKRFNEIIRRSISLEKHTCKKYLEAKNNNDLTLPVNIGDIDKIEEIANQATTPENQNDINNKLNTEIERWFSNA